MKIITRYLLIQFIKPLIFSSFAFGGLVLISEFFRELNYFMEKKASFLYVFLYLFFSLPWWIIQVLPVAVLLAVLFSLGTLAKNGEITAMKAAGINIWKVVVIFIFCGLFIGLADLSLREFVIPFSVNKAHNIRQEKIAFEQNLVKTEFKDLLISIPGNGRMTINTLNARTGTLSGIVIDYQDSSFVLTRQIVAKSGSYDGKWTLSDGVDRSFSSGLTNESPFSTKSLELPFKPSDFIVVSQRPEQMSSKQYLKYISQLETLGIPVEKDLIQLNLRWSSVFSHVIVMLIGIPFALGLGSRHGKILSFTFALIFAFVYWGVQAVGQSLGENRIISPFMAAWLSNFIFAFFGVYMTSNIKK
jgi:lipopolysaccharide export system permease protein